MTSELKRCQWDWQLVCSGKGYLANQMAPWVLAGQEGLLCCWVAGVQLHMQPSPILPENGGSFHLCLLPMSGTFLSRGFVGL